MSFQSAIVFGYNEYAKQIAQKVSHEYETFIVFVLDEASQNEAIKDGFRSEIFDLSDEWQSIEDCCNPEGLITFCALDNDAENVFLTISLRASFEKITIIAMAGDQESAAKLKSAGADKVMPILQITANIITEMLEKPTVTGVLHDLLYENSTLKIVQITVPENSFIIGKYLHEIEWREAYDVVVLAIVDHELSATFSFTSKGHNHHIDAGDILVVVGYEDKIDALSAAMGVDNG